MDGKVQELRAADDTIPTQQIAASMHELGVTRLELLQIHNLLDWQAHLPTLRALRERLLLAVVLGAVGAPLAYYAGGRIGAVGFGEPAMALAAIAAGWAIMTPLLFLAARRFDGYAPR